MSVSHSRLGGVNRLLLIDGHSMAYRAFFALPAENFTTSTGQHTNAVHGFTSMLIGLLTTEQPTHVAVAFDVGRESFRTESYPDYKATRSASPVEFRGQVELIKEVLDGLRITHLEMPGYEADDIIATLATEAGAKGFEVLISSGDRDALQLVTDAVTVLYPRKGVSDLVRMTPEAIQDKYGVPPHRYPELAALVGETSDNLPGVPGVGPKTAAKWIANFDGLDNILARAEQVPGKAGESLRAHLDDVRRNRRLNHLVRDLGLPVPVERMGRRDWDRDAITQLFAALEFRTLRDRLAQLYGGQAVKDPAGQAPAFRVDGVELGENEVQGWLEAHAAGGAALAFVGTWGSGTGDLQGIGLAAPDEVGAWIDCARLSPGDESALVAWLADADIPKTVHAGKGPLLAIWERGWELAGVVLDVALAAYLLRPDVRGQELTDLVQRHLGRELSAEGGGAQESLFDADESTTARDAMLRARAVLELAEVLRPELDTQPAGELMQRIELPLQVTLARCERSGIAVDRDVLDELRQEFDAAALAAQQAAWDSIGHEVNLGSPKQLQTVLFDELDMPRTKRTKTGWTTDAEALESLYARTEHPFLAALLAHRDRIKLRQTVDTLLAAIRDDGRIHTTYAQTIAATGRLSSLDPNLQNIPIRTELGRRIRSAFVAGPGYESLMSADYSQIEMRLMAHCSADEGLIAAFASGRDFHAEMAATVFGVDPGEVTGEMRARIKAMNYGLAYGLSAYGLAAQLGISTAEARTLMDDYFSRVGGVQRYLAEVVEEARRVGYTETLRGRRRHLPDLASTNRQRREMAERAALNSPIQGSAADIIKLAMLGVEDALGRAGLSSRMLLQVHDELVLEIAPGEQQAVEELVRTEMGTAMELAVPLEVSVGVGDSWFTAAH
ncbi:MAG: DNA polymerase I [Arachnia propionica]|uniref:DNA polymerase I n=1 Tax=Arachnia propionica TaxID=1750 RepID=UPI0026F9D3A4|nr:DNA polymerase I [Arachnia propionica]